MEAVKIQVDSLELDKTTEKAERLLELLHEAQEAIRTLAGQNPNSLDPPSRIEAKVIYSVEDLAEMFGKSPSTINRWIRNGDFGEYITAGKTKKVPAQGVQKYIEDHSGPVQKQVRTVRRRTAGAPAFAERI